MDQCQAAQTTGTGRHRALPGSAQISLRNAMSEALLGQKPPKQALDDLARDWQRNLRRAGVGKS